MLNRIAKNTVFGDHHQGDDRHEYQRRHAGDAQAEPLPGVSVCSFSSRLPCHWPSAARPAYR